jgi:Cu/Ag efflux protein CusF
MKREAIMQFARLRLALPLIAYGLVPPTAALSQETAQASLFHGRGVVKAIQPGTGALTLDHDDIKGFMPAMEMMYRVRSLELSRDLRPGDTVDFTIDTAKDDITEVELVSRAE